MLCSAVLGHITLRWLCHAVSRCAVLRRPDRYLLEVGDSSSAAVAKYNLEEMQRAERRVSKF